MSSALQDPARELARRAIAAAEPRQRRVAAERAARRRLVRTLQRTLIGLAGTLALGAAIAIGLDLWRSQGNAATRPDGRSLDSGMPNPQLAPEGVQEPATLTLKATTELQTIPQESTP